MANTRFNILSFCSGVAMLDEGVCIATPGARVVGYAERDAFAASVLLARMADASLEPAPVWCGNLEDADWSEWAGLVDCITAGFPCQPWSNAGQRLGVNDARWIWPSILAAIRSVRPRLVFLENVPGLFAPGGFESVIGGLAESRYVGAWMRLRASDTGASHKRERVFILAKLDDAEKQPEREQDDAWPGAGGRGGENDYIGSEDSVFAPGPRSSDWRDIIASHPHLAPVAKPGLRFVADGLAVVVDESRTDQLRCTGNGVVALQAAYAFARLAGRLGGLKSRT